MTQKVKRADHCQFLLSIQINYTLVLRIIILCLAMIRQIVFVMEQYLGGNQYAY